MNTTSLTTSGGLPNASQARLRGGRPGRRLAEDRLPGSTVSGRGRSAITGRRPVLFTSLPRPVSERTCASMSSQPKRGFIWQAAMGCCPAECFSSSTARAR